MCSSSYPSWLYLSGVFPCLEIAEVLNAHFEPVDWERCSYPEGIGSICACLSFVIFLLLRMLFF